MMNSRVSKLLENCSLNVVDDFDFVFLINRALEKKKPNCKNNERDKEIMYARYEQFKEPFRTYQYLGDKFGISRERVRQIEYDVLRMMKDITENDRTFKL